MLNKIYYRKAIAYTLILVLIAMTFPLRATYATTIEEEGNNRKITAINENKVRIEENGVIEELEVVKNSEQQIQKIISKNITTGVEETILIDSEKHTAYSTLTKETETFSPDEIDVEGEQLLAVGDTHQYKFSFAKIASTSGDISTVTGIAQILLKQLAVIGVSVTNPLASIVGMVSTITGVVQLVAGASSKKGLYVITEEYMRSTTKNGKVYKYLANRVTKIGVY